MKNFKYFFLILSLPFFLNACGEVCVRPMQFVVFGRGGEDDMVLPRTINGVDTELTMKKAYAAPAEIHQASRIAQRLDEIVYLNCVKMKDMTEEEKTKFKKDNAGYDKLVTDLTIVLRSPPEDYKNRLQDWLEEARTVMEK